MTNRNTLIFAEREDASVGEAGWEPGKGWRRQEEGSVQRAKKRELDRYRALQPY